MADSTLYGIQLHPCGQICYFTAGNWPGLAQGSYVVVRIDRGEALAQIMLTYSGEDIVNLPEISSDLLSETSPTLAGAAPTKLPESQLKSLSDAATNTSLATPPNSPNAQGEQELDFKQEITPTNNVDDKGQDNEPQEAESAPYPQPVQEKTIFAGELYRWDSWEEDGQLAEVLAEEEEPEPTLCLTPSSKNMQPILRPASPEDMAMAMANEEGGRTARRYCMQRARAHRLDMKLVMADYLLDASKIIFYFTAPNRIDFRELVKDLVKEFRTRIELRQIGVRHETQMIGATGNCGMVCCCRRYMRKFAPVTIKMAKEQNLFLNPTKISGTCGRLLCCLAFEQDSYEEFHSRCPKMGKKYNTKNGMVKVLRSSIFRNSLSLLPEEGDEFEVTLDEWKDLEPARQGQAQGQAQGQERNQTSRQTPPKTENEETPRSQRQFQPRAQNPAKDSSAKETTGRETGENPETRQPNSRSGKGPQQRDRRPRPQGQNTERQAGERQPNLHQADSRQIDNHQSDEEKGKRMGSGDIENNPKSQTRKFFAPKDKESLQQPSAQQINGANANASEEPSKMQSLGLSRFLATTAGDDDND